MIYPASVTTLIKRGPSLCPKRQFLRGAICLLTGLFASALLPAQAPCNSGFFDQLVMDFNNAYAYSSPPTVNGVRYFIQAEGTWGIANGNQRDAAFNLNPNVHVPGNCDACWRLNGNFGFRPIPDVYSPAHSYTYEVTGDGNPLTFSFIDTQYGDNHGSLTFTIYALYDSASHPLQTPLQPAISQVPPATQVLLEVIPDAHLAPDSTFTLQNASLKWLGSAAGQHYYQSQQPYRWSGADSLAQALGAQLVHP